MPARDTNKETRRWPRDGDHALWIKEKASKRDANLCVLTRQATRPRLYFLTRVPSHTRGSLLRWQGGPHDLRIQQHLSNVPPGHLRSRKLPSAAWGTSRFVLFLTTTPIVPGQLAHIVPWTWAFKADGLNSPPTLSESRQGTGGGVFTGMLGPKACPHIWGNNRHLDPKTPL